MSFDDLKVAVNDGIATIAIDRGDGRNALRLNTLLEICAAFDASSSDDSVRAIILTGIGKHFSAGADFAFLEQLTQMKTVDIRDQIYAAFQGAAKRIWNCAKPVIAAINGSAITVGCELALACDVRIVTSSAKFQESWIRLGLIPPLGGLFLLPHHVGLGRASEILLSGREVSADEAIRIGLATTLVEPDNLQQEAQVVALRYAALPPLAFRSAKEGIRRSTNSSMAAEWETNLLAQSILLGTDDFKEGLDAITARRPPLFLGK